MTRLRFRLLKLKQVARRTSALSSLASLANPTTFARSSHCRCKKTTTINNIGSQIIHIYNFRSLGPDCLKAVNKRIMRLCLSGASHPRGSLPGQFAFFHTWIMEYLHAWVFETTYQQNFEIIQLNQLILPGHCTHWTSRGVSWRETPRQSGTLTCQSPPTELHKDTRFISVKKQIESVNVGSNAYPTQADVFIEYKIEEKKEYISKHRLGRVGR